MVGITKETTESNHKFCAETSANDLSNAIKALFILQDELYVEIISLDKSGMIDRTGYLKECIDAMSAVFNELMRIKTELDTADGQ